MKIIELFYLTMLGCGMFWILTLISAIGVGGILENNWIWKFIGITCISVFLIASYLFAKESLYK